MWEEWLVGLLFIMIEWEIGFDGSYDFKAKVSKYKVFPRTSNIQIS